MGLSHIRPLSLLLILLIILVLFGTKKVKNLGSELGIAIKHFRRAIEDGTELKQHDEMQGENEQATGVYKPAHEDGEQVFNADRVLRKSCENKDES